MTELWQNKVSCTLYNPRSVWTVRTVELVRTVWDLICLNRFIIWYINTYQNNIFNDSIIIYKNLKLWSHLINIYILWKNVCALKTITHSVHMVIDGYLNSQWKHTVYVVVFYFCGIDREYLLIILVSNNLTQQKLFKKKLIKFSLLLVLWNTCT